MKKKYGLPIIIIIDPDPSYLKSFNYKSAMNNMNYLRDPKKKMLVLDIDETLVSSSVEPVQDYDVLKQVK